MVFGNKGDTSGSGVAFSRDEVTGEPEPSGDFLVNAQGEDVVSGVRNTQDISDLREVMPEAHEQLMDILRTLEAHYKDMQDTEFTIEEGRLYMLQTRNAKRPAQAMVRFACDVVDEGLLTKSEAIATIDCEKLDALLHPTFDPTVDYAVLAKGVAASPGAAKGEIVFSASEAVEAAASGRDVILVRPFTEAEDVAGFHAARGILTAEGGKASHAALVARGMGRPAVTGASALDIDIDKKELRVGETLLCDGDCISIDGTTGQITIDDVPLVEPQMGEHFERVLQWSDELRRLGVRANADTPEDARKAREFGAEGIGLCRTEHMFMAADRQPKMREMILSDTIEDRRAALDELLPLQQQDFEEVLEAMDGLPVTIRLLDPPLHEFLPPDEDDPRAHALREVNPMLGTRGCRLAILHPEIYEMQVRAIMRAQCAVTARLGHPPKLEVMVPLVDYERELELIKALILRVAEEEGVAREHFLVGTMIELPRACFLADTIAAQADFFSFGTNDLTQTALGFSRDDIEGKILAPYIEAKVFDRSPFETLDTPGVGQLLRMGAWLGRKTKLEIKLGICGEHGGDPDSIDFFHNSGLNYVSCSPFRVPVARVSAAQAAIRRGDDGGW
jgi:pyruvate,orthophosphate dikinase